MTQPITSRPWAIVVFDIDGVVRDVSGSYRRAIADTVEQFTGAYRPTPADIDALKAEGQWNNDWQASQELIYRYFEAQGRSRLQLNLDYDEMVSFFQARYRGPELDPQQWSGYITQEPLLMGLPYLDSLSRAGIAWGFFSGATRGSASYILEKRLGLKDPILITMEDAPGKPDPTGLFLAVKHLEQQSGANQTLPVLYVGDTVADLYTIRKANEQQPNRRWVGVGVLPPHVQATSKQSTAYKVRLQQAGAEMVITNVERLLPQLIAELVRVEK